ncbi:hypothetical protein [Okeania sp. SIO1F9]|uniref:hypothetical protein n=1 Tax=Okeania sp. SIO1F9 TaxID=2607813 RepID=UPI00144BC57E|nr:hypothetical protein [Okeania sp. SIO1F9]NET78303.1 hypothetical protein [Okeania sp. SIO1F9]
MQLLKQIFPLKVQENSGEKLLNKTELLCIAFSEYLCDITINEGKRTTSTQSSKKTTTTNLRRQKNGT